MVRRNKIPVILERCGIDDFIKVEDFWTDVFRKRGLEVLGPEEFAKAPEKMWRKKIGKYRSDIYSMVKNPIEADSYEELINKLLEYRKFVRLWARGNEYSIKKNRSELEPDVIKEMTMIATGNTWKKYYFEAKFKQSHEDKRSLTVGFTEWGGKILGYDVSVPFELRSLLNILGVENRQVFEYANGLWLPPE